MGAEVELFNFGHRLLVSGIVVLGTFPAKKPRQIPKNRPKRQFLKLTKVKLSGHRSHRLATVEMVQYFKDVSDDTLLEFILPRTGPRLEALQARTGQNIVLLSHFSCTPVTFGRTFKTLVV